MKIASVGLCWWILTLGESEFQTFKPIFFSFSFFGGVGGGDGGGGGGGVGGGGSKRVNYQCSVYSIYKDSPLKGAHWQWLFHRFPSLDPLRLHSPPVAGNQTTHRSYVGCSSLPEKVCELKLDFGHKWHNRNMSKQITFNVKPFILNFI